MRMQVTGARLAPTAGAVRAESERWRVLAERPGRRAEDRQRGPMFLLAEACTQLTQRASRLPARAGAVRRRGGIGIRNGRARRAGRVGQGAGRRGRARGDRGREPSAAPAARAHAAGLRNALFDSTFFGVEHALRTRAGLPSGASYALAAALAVTLDFPLDVAVKRMMAEPLGAAAGAGSSTAVAAVARLFRERGVRATFRGLVPKAAEFTVSYATAARRVQRGGRGS